MRGICSVHLIELFPACCTLGPRHRATSRHNRLSLWRRSGSLPRLARWMFQRDTCQTYKVADTMYVNSV